MAETDNILTKLQDLLVYLIPQLNKYLRDQKFVLGDGMTFRGLTGEAHAFLILPSSQMEGREWLQKLMFLFLHSSLKSLKA
jgi:hypothetical protein